MGYVDDWRVHKHNFIVDAPTCSCSRFIYRLGLLCYCSHLRRRESGSRHGEQPLPSGRNYHFVAYFNLLLLAATTGGVAVVAPRPPHSSFHVGASKLYSYENFGG